MPRRTLVCLAVAALALAAAVVGSSRSHHAVAGKRILEASSCPAGSASEREAAAERDADAKGRCLPLNKPENAIESVLMAGERTARQTKPFDTPPPPPGGEAPPPRDKKAKNGGAR